MEVWKWRHGNVLSPTNMQIKLRKQQHQDRRGFDSCMHVSSIWNYCTDSVSMQQNFRLSRPCCRAAADILPPNTLTFFSPIESLARASVTSTAIPILPVLSSYMQRKSQITNAEKQKGKRVDCVLWYHAPLQLQPPANERRQPPHVIQVLLLAPSQ